MEYAIILAVAGYLYMALITFLAIPDGHRWYGMPPPGIYALLWPLCVPASVLRRVMGW